MQLNLFDNDGVLQRSYIHPEGKELLMLVQWKDRLYLFHSYELNYTAANYYLIEAVRLS
jgi:hypothetical protein